MTSSEAISLKEYFDRVMLEKDKALQAALASAKEAVQVAESNSQLWRLSQNEWRGALTDGNSKYMLKSEFVIFKESNDAVLEDLKKFKNLHEGEKKGLSDGWGWLAGAIGLALAIASYFAK